MTTKRIRSHGKNKKTEYDDRVGAVNDVMVCAMKCSVAITSKIS